MAAMVRDLLIRDFELRMVEPGCFPGASFWRAVATLKDDISEVLPYLNAELEGADYNPNGQVVLWQDENGKYAFRPHQIDIGPVEDREKGQRLANYIVGVVNDIWSRRDGIEPDFEPSVTPPNVLDIYKLLPRTNCKECGYPTCFAFASALRDGKADLTQCPPLFHEEYRENKQGLLSLLEGSGNGE
ncbi:MAG: (Fe-S)-binding protein [Dehalococcoidia bacterium]